MCHFFRGVLLFSLFFLQPAVASPDYRQHVPAELEPWVDWVLWKHKELACPVSFQSEERYCIWPGSLQLQLTESGGRFTQHITVYKKSIVLLPGGFGRWPENVQVDGSPVAVLSRQDLPAINLYPGSYQIAGEYAWSSLPESLRLPETAGIVLLELNGKNIKYPLIKGGEIWLGASTKQSISKRPMDKLSLVVTRKLRDGHPFEVTTLMMLQVSGQQREVVLGAPLLDGFVPLQVRGKLPARLGSDGKLRVQVKPGQWQLEVDAYNPNYVQQVALSGQTAPWPQEEVWAFEARPEVRLVEISNGTQVDPRQTRLPQQWRQLPAYLLKPGEALQIKVIRRGDPLPDPDNLRLKRTLWLDFSGQGYTMQDRLQGKMTSGWRLSVDPDIELGRVTLNGEPQFITRMDEDRPGVEVRRGAIDLHAESRLNNSREIPVTGWGRDLQQVSADLNLPPGWRLLATTGVDVEHASWLKQWSLYDLFVVFIVAFGVGRLWGWRWAAVTLITLGLIWHEPGAPRGIWFYLLVVAALSRVITEGKMAYLLRSAWLGGLVVLALIVLPFTIDQARTGLYPQLQLTAHQYPVSMPAPAPPPIREMSDAPAPMPQEMVIKRKANMAKDAIGGLTSSIQSYREPKSKIRKQWLPDKNAQVQTGPGLPDWQWRRITLRWDGPVTRSQQMQFLLAGPKLNMVLNFLRILLVGFLAWLFVDWTRSRLRTSRSSGASSSASVAAVVMMIATGFGGVQDARAGDYPSSELLEELEQRLIEPPQCEPQCADIAYMRLDILDDNFSIFMRVDAAQESAAPVPVGALVAVSAWIDGEPSPLLRTGDQRWMQIPVGKHELEIIGRMPDQRQLSLALPLLPHKLEVSAKGWAVDGVNPQGIPNKQLLLSRVVKDDTQNSDNKLTPRVLPPFIRVERTLRLGMEWSVETRVTRLSPMGVPVSIQIPLLPGESVVTEGFPVKNSSVLVTLSPGARGASWKSRLAQSDQITLTAAQSSGWIERWKVDVSPIWHVASEGIAPAHHQQQGNWLPQYLPWPGDEVILNITRPEGVPGTLLTVVSSNMTVNPGKRATDTLLSLKVRASQGGRYEMTLPQQAQLQSVIIDGRSQPIRQEERKVLLPLHPGEQQYVLKWREPEGISTGWETPQVDLGHPSVNARIKVKLAGDRWTLFAFGPTLGPAVLFWGELLVLIAIAIVLGRLKQWTPLGTGSWFLLGIGLTQVSPASALLVVGALLALGYRRQIDTTGMKYFNLLQIALALLVIVGASSLLWAVQQGLLGVPRMQIGGNGSTASELNWYQDRSDALLPQASIISLPLSVYRWLMLAWALWLALSVLKWSQWAWSAFTHGERWRHVKLKLPRLNSKPKAKQDDSKK
ncbi:MAG: hypothetical protein IZT60_01175 [Gammaproteobacteria bacterium]|nr:hypothetical protein [Gammaproteobacteria bacterium]